MAEEKLGRIAVVHGEPHRLRWLGSHAYCFQAIGLALRLIQSDAETYLHIAEFSGDQSYHFLQAPCWNSALELNLSQVFVFAEWTLAVSRLLS